MYTLLPDPLLKLLHFLIVFLGSVVPQRPSVFHTLRVVCPLVAVVVLYVLLLLLDILAPFSQYSWWDAHQMLEMAVEVALISKSHGMSDLSNRPFFLEQQRLGTLNPARNHILMGSQTGRLLEQTAKMRDAHADGGG